VTSLHFPTLRVSQLACLAIVPCAFLGLSCSKGLQSVSGKVLHKGQPIKGAVVTLHPKGNNDIKVQRPSGLTGDDGTFSLTTGQESGAPPGEYVVTVIWLQPPPATGKKAISTEGSPEPVDQLQGRYADPKTSKLTVTVKPGVGQLEPITVE
jgi:hypothetical protein